MPFSREPWESPESSLEAADYCAVCLIDTNESGAEKVKARCKLPLRKTPGGPYNVNAIHAAAGAHGILGVKGVSPDEKRKAARKLVSLYKEIDEQAPDSTYHMAGMKPPSS